MADSSQNITQALLASRETALPVTLTLGEQVLEIQTLLRFMPARRAVYAGALDGKPVIIKLFSSHPRSRREVQVEQERLAALAVPQMRQIKLNWVPVWYKFIPVLFIRGRI